jgi:hypothetical protein
MKAQYIRTAIFALLTTVTLSFSSSVIAQSKDEIINLSYFIAFGRYANSGEMNYWRQNLGGKNISQMVANHRQYMNSNPVEKEKAIRNAYMDAFGWQPSADEIRYWSGQNKTYAELMKNHIDNWLNVYPDKKEHVIRQSYYKVFNRNATPDEVKYWKKQPTYSFVQLVATHTTWKQNNQRSSTVTGIRPNLKTNDVSTASISQQAVAQVVAAGGANVVAAGGGNVVAAGGGNVISAGGGN